MYAPDPSYEHPLIAHLRRIDRGAFAADLLARATRRGYRHPLHYVDIVLSNTIDRVRADAVYFSPGVLRSWMCSGRGAVLYDEWVRDQVLPCPPLPSGRIPEPAIQLVRSKSASDLEREIRDVADRLGMTRPNSATQLLRVLDGVRRPFGWDDLESVCTHAELWQRDRLGRQGRRILAGWLLEHGIACVPQVATLPIARNTEALHSAANDGVSTRRYR